MSCPNALRHQAQADGRGLGPYGGVLLEPDDLPLGELLAAAMFMKAQPSAVVV